MDVGDNVGGGTPADSTILLAAAQALGIRSFLVTLCDPEAAAACAAAGVGGEVAVALGGKLDRVHGRPLPVRGRVAALVADDPVGGAIAVLRVGGGEVIVTSRRKPYHHLRDFTALGLDPAAQQVVAVKIGYLEPELRRLARHALLALTPGAVDQDIPGLTYSRVLRPIYPLDPDMPDPALDVQVFGA